MTGRQSFYLGFTYGSSSKNEEKCNDFIFAYVVKDIFSDLTNNRVLMTNSESVSNADGMLGLSCEIGNVTRTIDDELQLEIFQSYFPKIEHFLLLCVLVYVATN